MSQVHYIVYSLSDGSVRRSGVCQDYDLNLQPQAGEGVMLATADAVVVSEVNLTPVKEAASIQIEASADAVAASLITLSPRKVMTTFAIKEESDRWTTGGTATDFPFLHALALANGTTIDAEKAAFDTVYAATVPAGAKINAAAIAAQRVVAAATNVGAIAAATKIDWAAVLA